MPVTETKRAGCLQVSVAGSVQEWQTELTTTFGDFTSNVRCDQQWWLAVYHRKRRFRAEVKTVDRFEIPALVKAHGSLERMLPDAKITKDVHVKGLRTGLPDF